MTVEQFKAWFEGFSEGVDGAPTKEQFDRIRQKVAELNGPHDFAPLLPGKIERSPLVPIDAPWATRPVWI